MAAVEKARWRRPAGIPVVLSRRHVWEEESEPEAGERPGGGGALGPGELVPRPWDQEPSFGRGPVDTLRMGPKPPPAQCPGCADLSGAKPSGGLCLLSLLKVRSERGGALSCPHTSSGTTSQWPPASLPSTARHPTSRPSWAESPAWAARAFVGSGEGSPRGAARALPGQRHPAPSLPAPPPSSRLIPGEAGHPGTPASRSGRRLSSSPGMRRDQVAQRREPGLRGPSYACIISAKQRAHRAPGPAPVPG